VDCQLVIRELCSYLDGELEPAALADLERHLSRCKDCRLVVDTTRKTIEIYCNAQPVALPGDVRARLHEALLKRLGRTPTT
jgi:anti-sigma factor RsiW